MDLGVLGGLHQVLLLLNSSKGFSNFLDVSPAAESTPTTRTPTAAGEVLFSAPVQLCLRSSIWWRGLLLLLPTPAIIGTLLVQFYFAAYISCVKTQYRSQLVNKLTSVNLFQTTAELSIPTTSQLKEKDFYSISIQCSFHHFLLTHIFAFVYHIFCSQQQHTFRTKILLLLVSQLLINTCK